jgi:hypothetical protein
MSKRPMPEVPRLLLGVSSLDQPVRTTRDRQLEVASRFKEPESLAVALVKGVAAGAQGVIAPPTLDVREALAELNEDLPIFARVAHTSPAEDLRWDPVFLADPGDVESRSSRAGKRAGHAARNLLPMSLAGDLASRVLPRMEREVVLFNPKSVRGIAVAAGATDLALAANQPKFFERMVRFARQRRWLVGFETRNLGHFLARAATWDFAEDLPDFVMGPVNPRGVGMMPNAERTLAEIKTSKLKVIACELRAGGLVALDEAAAYARRHGAWGVCPELVEMDDVPKELKALAPALAA